MADYKKLVPFILRWEGGFVNDPYDRGGATNKGVTIATWKNYCKRVGKEGTVETLRKMSDDDWMAIFKRSYWDRAKADKIESQSVANIFVDWIWASGVHAIRHVQRLVGVDADGIVGKKTLAAINAQDPYHLFRAIHNDRITFVNDIVRNRPNQQRFLGGWLNRIHAIHYEEERKR